MGLSWGEWIRFVLAPLIIAAIAAYVATKNARKTPHERLKNLVEIYAKMPNEMDTRRVVRAAISRELVDFDRRLAADQRGPWTGMRERSAQVRLSTEVVLTVIVLLPLGASIIVGVVDSSAGSEASTWLTVVAVFYLLTSVGSIAAGKRPRASLKVDRTAAQILATFPHVHIQHIALTEELTSKPGDSYYDVAQRLLALGVLERSDQRDSTGSSVFRVTPFGKQALAESLEESTRQRIAHWESVAGENAVTDVERGSENS